MYAYGDRSIGLSQARWVVDHLDRTDIVEIVAAIQLPRVAIVRMASGWVVVREDGATPVDGLARAVDSLTDKQRSLLWFDRDEALASERFDEVARLFRAGSPAEARELGIDAAIDLAQRTGGEIWGHGARPVGPRGDIAGRFDAVARLIRTGRSALAFTVAREGLEELASDVLRIAAPTPWEQPIDLRRAPAAADDFFAEGTDANRVRKALQTLMDPGAPATERSHGKVDKPETDNPRTHKPEPRGLTCARIFGPIDDHACLCGKYRSRDHAGVTCEKCGVLVASPTLRDWRWGHIALPEPVIHPDLVDDVGAAIGRSGAEVRRILDDEDGDLERSGAPFIVAEVRAAGADNLLVSTIPLIPPGDRPPRSEQVAGHEVLQPHPSILPYRMVINRANRFARLLELHAPPIILLNEHTMLQRAVDELVRVMRTPQPTASAPLERRPVHIPTFEWDPWYFGEREDPTTEGVQAALWLDTERLLIQRSGRTGVLDRAGAVLEAWDSDERVAAWCSADGRQVVYLAPFAFIREGEDGRIETPGGGVYARGTGWLQQWPAQLPCTLVEHGEPEFAWATDAHTGDSYNIAEDSDRPGVACWSRTGTLLWTSDGGYGGAIVSAVGGLSLAHIDDDWPEKVMHRDGRVTEAPDEEPEPIEAGCNAIALGEDGAWRYLRQDGIVGDEQMAFVQLLFPFRAAAWSLDGSELVLVTDDALLFLEVDGVDVRLARELPLPAF